MMKELSERENEAMRLRVCGLKQEEIAIEMGCGVASVATFLRRAAQKLGARSSEQSAVLWALDRQQRHDFEYLSWGKA